MRELFTAIGTIFLAAEYAFLAANVTSVALFAGLLAIIGLYAVKVDQRREEVTNAVRRTAGQRSFVLPDMTFVPVRTVKTVARPRAMKVA